MHPAFSKRCATTDVGTAALVVLLYVFFVLSPVPFFFLSFFLVFLQAYGRAIELEPRRLFSLVQSGLVLLALGNYTEAQGLLQSALEVEPQHVPALFAAAQLLLASAKHRIAQGTPGWFCTVAAWAPVGCQSCLCCCAPHPDPCMAPPPPPRPQHGTAASLALPMSSILSD